jgi:WD40 repeat protein
MAEHLNARTETEQKASGASGRRRLLIAIVSVAVLSVLVVVVRNATGGGDGDAGNSGRASDEPRPIEEVDAGRAALTSVAFSPDDSVLAVGDLAGLVHLVDPETGETTATIESGEGGVHAVAFSPNGSLIAGGRDDTGADTGSVSVWDSETRELVASLGGDGELDWINTIDALAFSPDGHLLAGGDFGSVRLWDVDARRQIAVLEGQDNQVQSVAFSPDGRLLAAGGLGSTIDVWDVETRERVMTLPQQYPKAVALTRRPPPCCRDGGRHRHLGHRGTGACRDPRHP